MQDFDPHEAATHCLCPVARFRDLSAGELFRFPGMKETLERTRTGYRHISPRSPVFSTGAKTAVIPVDRTETRQAVARHDLQKNPKYRHLGTRLAIVVGR